MKPTNPVYVGGPLLDLPDQKDPCPKCKGRQWIYVHARPYGRKTECPFCNQDDAENNDYPED